MGCFKITWNIFNLCYSVFAVVIAFESQSIPLEVISLIIFTIHIFFTASVNGLASKSMNESIHSYQCALLLQNCIILLSTALLLIFTADRDLYLYALPFVCYISLLHIACLCVACLSQKGYRFLQLICKRRCCRRCECNQQNSTCLRKCSQFEDCLAMTISCTYCCKPKLRKKKPRASVTLKQELRKNLPKSSKSSLNFSKPSETSLPQTKKLHYKESSDYLETLKSGRKISNQHYVQSRDGTKLVGSKRKVKTAQNKTRVEPQRDRNFENSFNSLPLKEEAGQISSLHLMIPQQNSINGQGQQFDEIDQRDLKSLTECIICGQLIDNENEAAVVPQCQHIFHAHCLRTYARERGQRECAKCKSIYKHLVAYVQQKSEVEVHK